MKPQDQNKFKVTTGLNTTFLDLLDEAGMSGAELARRMDVSETTVSHWKTGRTKVPGSVVAYLGLLTATRNASR